jgi:hypothetical protein
MGFTAIIIHIFMLGIRMQLKIALPCTKSRPMKKLTLIITGFLTGAVSFAQTIPNAGFETWINNTESPTIYSTPQGWITEDIIQTAFFAAFGDSTYVAHSVTQVAGHNGSYGVQMSNVISNEGDTLNGGIISIATAQDFFNYAFGLSMEGFTISTRPANLTGYYKLNALGGDTAGFDVVMSKWNTSTNSRDVLMDIQLSLTTNMSNWTSFTVPLTYAYNEYPDTVFIAAGLNSSSSNHPVHPGTAFTIDDLAFTGSVPAGVQEQHSDSADLLIYPNPFTDKTTLKTNDVQLENATLELYDVLGNKVRVMKNLSGNSIVISRDGLTNGIYFYQLTNENSVIATGKITVE